MLRTTLHAYYWLAAGLIALAATYALAKPIWDWDVLAYLFAAYTALGADTLSAHTQAYAALQTLPTETQALLTTSEPFRQTLFTTPESMAQLMPFYNARQGYILPLAGLVRLGIPPLWAVQGVNLMGQILLGTTLALWLRRLNWPKGNLLWALLALTVLLVFPSVMKVARWSNPDGLVAATYLLGVYLLATGHRGWVWAWGAYLVLKPTGLILLAPVGVLFLYQKRLMEATQLALLGLAGVLLLWAYPGYGLAQLWQHTFVAANPFPAQNPVAFSWEDYLGYLHNRIGGLHGRDLLLFGITLLATTRLALQKQLLGLALAAGVGLHVLLFPGFWERLIIGPVLALGLLGFALTSPDKAPRA